MDQEAELGASLWRQVCSSAHAFRAGQRSLCRPAVFGRATRRMGMKTSHGHVQWKPCWRVIPARYMEKRVLLKVSEPDDLETIALLDDMTNERLRQERGEVSAVAP